MDELGAGPTILEGLELAVKFPHLEKRHHQEDEDQNGKAGEPVQAPGNLLEQADKPEHVEPVGEDARNENALLLEPIRGLHIKGLEALHVVQQPIADRAQGPGNHRRKHQHYGDRHAERDEKRERLRQTRFEPLLQRPDDGEEKQGKGERRKDGAREIKRHAKEDDGANNERGARNPSARIGPGPGCHRVASHWVAV